VTFFYILTRTRLFDADDIAWKVAQSKINYLKKLSPAFAQSVTRTNPVGFSIEFPIKILTRAESPI